MDRMDDTAGFKVEWSMTMNEFQGGQKWIEVGLIGEKRVARKAGYTETEVEIMTLLSKTPHPNLIQLIEVNPTDRWLIMEGVKSGLTLYEYYTRIHPTCFSFPEAIDLMKQIASGLEFLHNLNVIHHDLNYNNVLVSLSDDEPNVVTLKLCDFGISEMANHEGYGSEKNRTSGTNYWRAPEQLLRYASVPITTKIDIFAFGLIASHIIYSGRTVNQYHYTVPIPLIKFVESCQQTDPTSRPTASQCLQKLDLEEMQDGMSFGHEVSELYQNYIDSGRPVSEELNVMLTKVADAYGIDTEN